MTKFELLKGTKDFESKEMIQINEVLKIIIDMFEKFGFKPFDTPIIEMMETLTFKYDDDAEIVNEIFKLTDRGKRELGLRYDLTTPMARYIVSKKQLKLPFKRYQIGKVFRDGPIKKGRLREFTQCDGDIVGISGMEVESELLYLFFKTYNKLGINSVIEINNNKILRGAFLQVGFKEEDLSNLILSVDKLKKIGLEDVLKEIKNKGLNDLRARDAIKILSSNSISEIRKIAIDNLLKEGIDELEALVNLLDDDIKYRINFSMSRGLDIYTGNIWEVYDLDERINSSLGSGGRYDKLILEYGELNSKGDNKINKENKGDKDNEQDVMPAVGISFGLIPILSVLNDNNDINLKNSLTNILVVPLDKKVFTKALEIANKLRDEGNFVEINYDFKLKKAFSYCDYYNIEKIIVIGERDLEVKKVKIKNLKTKEEEELEI